MKKILFFTLTLILCFSTSQAQIVTIPDANFKALLVANTSINTNADTEIQVSEAQSFTGTINVSNGNIGNLIGIEAFTALTGLDCSYNQLVDLNTNSNTLLLSLICNSNQIVSLGLNNNTALTKLICSNNQLADLNTNNNIALDTINCSFNQISSLDFSSNSALMYIQVQNNVLLAIDMGTINSVVDLICYNNQLNSIAVSNFSALNSIQCNNNNLSGLDISNCSSLVACWCYNNNLEYLNVQNGNNSNFTDFDAQTNPLLTCIMVDSVAFSVANWALIPSVASFATFCTALDVNKLEQESFSVYPNPANKELNVLLENNIQPTSYSIINVDGREIISKPWSSTIINIETLIKGIYILRIRTEDNSIINKKFVTN